MYINTLWEGVKTTEPYVLITCSYLSLLILPEVWNNLLDLIHQMNSLFSEKDFFRSDLKTITCATPSWFHFVLLAIS